MWLEIKLNDSSKEVQWYKRFLEQFCNLSNSSEVLQYHIVSSAKKQKRSFGKIKLCWYRKRKHQKPDSISLTVFSAASDTKVLSFSSIFSVVSPSTVFALSFNFCRSWTQGMIHKIAPPISGGTPARQNATSQVPR